MFSPNVLRLIETCETKVYSQTESFKKFAIKLPSYAGGMYNTDLDIIIINIDYRDVCLDFIVLHELVHWTGSVSRLARKIFVEAEKGRYPNFLEREIEELTAQFGMYRLAIELGLNRKDSLLAFEFFSFNISEMKTKKAKQNGEHAAQWLLNQMQLKIAA